MNCRDLSDRAQARANLTTGKSKTNQTKAVAEFDDSNFDESFFDDDAPAATQKHTMALVKLELQNRDDDNLRGFCENHRDSLVDNADFPGPHRPTLEVYNAALTAYVGALGEVAELETQLAEAVRQKNEKRAVIEGHTTTRGGYVQEVSGGVESKIVGTGFGVKSAASPTTSLPQVANLSATMGDMEGEVDLGWDRIAEALGFQVEYREHPGGTTWTRLDVPVTGSKCSVPGLTPGHTYAFRVRAIGPKQLVGPWSDLALKMAP